MAKKSLLVVESPAKAKTINKYLGSKFVVEASVGHVRDLKPFRLGVDVDNNFAPDYQTIRGKGEILKKIRKLAGEANEVLIATDPDREGEAIAWHLAEEVKKTNDNVKRVLFNEITKLGIQRGIKDSRDINSNLFMSQQARRVMDRLIGYKVSPFVSTAMLDKTSKALSAGRVQSVALRLICERDEEVSNFVPIDYWNIAADFAKEGQKKTFNARLAAFDGNQIKNPEGGAGAKTDAEKKEFEKRMASFNFIKSEEEAADLIDRIKKEDFSIEKVTTKKVKRKPSAPFTTSLLQQEASRRLGFSNKKTMQVAQRLYEGVSIGKEHVGLITYMRTDSTRLSPESEQAAKEFIQDNYGKEYVPAKTPKYKSKSSNVQDAHEAIRPTSMQYTPDETKEFLGRDEARLYALIFNRFLASQMNPAEYDQTSVDIKGGEFLFKASGSILTFKGFLAVYQDFGNENEGESKTKLPKNLEKNDNLDLEKVESSKSQTKSRPRYNEASLVKELDELGIGRPSTYAQIVGTLIDRKYVELQKKAFHPTELGGQVNEILIKNFPELFNVDFTADMERELDVVAEGGKTYENLLAEFYAPFSKSLEKAQNSDSLPEIKCEECGGKMEIKVGRKGRFLGCSNYPKCKNTRPLPGDEKKNKPEPVVAEGIECPKCGGKMLLRQGRFGRFYGCADYPKCKGILPLSTHVKCPECKEGELVEKFSPKTKKKFWGCSNYPKCKYLTNREPIDKECPECGNYYVEVRFKKENDEWQKYAACPQCATKVEVKFPE